jgi:ubiquitin carboxyl-terminal hydrolase 8
MTDLTYYKTKGLSGLCNLGNTCYMNSALQCLSHTMNLTHYFLSRKYEEDITKSNSKRLEYHLILRYIDTITHMWDKNQLLAPKTFKKTLEAFVKRFVGNKQHDSHECIIFILDLLHKSLCVKVEVNIKGTAKTDNDKIKKLAAETWKMNFSSNYSYIIENFYGQVHNTLTCPDIECNNKSHSFDPYSCISLNVPSGNKSTLEDCFIESGKPEILDDDNKWFCDGCKTKKNAVLTTSLWTVPDILIIHLKKFSCNGKKIDKKIEFDINKFEMSKYISKNNNKKNILFELYAVSNHSGNEQGGHYWSYCKRDDKWFNFNDSEVSEISEDRIICPENYVLFFKRKQI